MKFCRYLFAFIFAFLLLLFTANKSYSQNSAIVYLEWLDNPLETMIINLVTEPSGDLQMQYRKKGSDEDWKVSNTRELSLPNTSQSRYRAILSGLHPGTEYEFYNDSMDEVRYFRTAPESIEEPIRFIIGGDITETRGDEIQRNELREIFEAVTDLAAKENPLFLIVGGDYVHSESGFPDPEDWLYFLEYWSNHLVTENGGFMIPFIGAIGNHEAPNRYGDSPIDAQNFHGYFSYPGELWENLRSYGFLDFSDYLSIITLDTGHTHSVSSQTGWLRNTIDNRSGQTHIFPVYHVPGWPTFRTMRDGTGLIDDIRNEWHPIFRDHDIRFVFEHHDHSYKRTNAFKCTTPINNRLACEEDDDFGVIYLGGGTWGSLVREIHPNFTDGPDTWVHAVNELENNFVLVEVSESIRKISAVSLTRGIIDEFMDYIKLDPPDDVVVNNLSETGFSVQWSEVEGSDEYRIDIAYDDQFNNPLPGYNNLRITDELSVELENLEPNRDYYIRLRSVNVYDQSKYSATVRAALIPTPPVISEATEITVTGFTANWQPVDRTTGYVIDVSEDESFQNILIEYNTGADHSISYRIEDLIPGRRYYYRIRAAYEDLLSENSATESAQTTGIDLERSEIEASLLRVLANGEQTSEIEIRLTGDDGEPLEGVDVKLNTENSDVIIDATRQATDQFGTIHFMVSSDVDGFAQFSAFVGNFDLNLSIRIEFIEVLQEPKLGDNFPNPFTNQTLIPVTLPENGRIRIDIINYAGARLQTIVDEERSAGYYEIPFNASGISAGVYLIRMVTDSGMQINKMTVL